MKIYIGKNIFLRSIPLLIFCFLVYLMIPLTYSTRTIDPLLTIRFLILIFNLCLAYLFLFFYLKHINFLVLRNSLTISVFFFTLTSLISGISAVNRAEYLYSLTRDCSNLLLYIILILYIYYNILHINMIIKTIIFSAMIFVFLGLGQYFGGWFLTIPGHETFYSTFANRNLFASINILIFPFLLYGFFRLPKIWQILSVITIISATFTITVIRARAVFLAVFLASYSVLLILSFYRLKIGRSDLKSGRIILLVIILTALISFGISKSELFSEMHPEISYKRLGSDTTLFVRIYAWKKTWSMIKEHPLTGIGGGNWKINLPKYGLEGKRLETGAYQYIRPHNDYLWVWAENGFIGFILYLLIFIIAIVYGLKILKTKGENKILIILLISGLIGYMMIAFFSFPRERIYHSIILMTYLAMISGLYSRSKSNHDKKEVFLNSLIVRIVITLGAMFLAAAMLSYSYQRLKSEIHFYFAYNARGRNQFNFTIAAIDKIDPGIFNISPTGIPVQWYRGNAYFQTGVLNKAFHNFLQANQTHPYHIFTLNNIGSCYELYGDHDSAKRFYYKILDLSHYLEETLINLSVVYYNTKDYVNAYKIISLCSIDSNNPRRNSYKAKIEEKLFLLKED